MKRLRAPSLRFHGDISVVKNSASPTRDSIERGGEPPAGCTAGAPPSSTIQPSSSGLAASAGAPAWPADQSVVPGKKRRRSIAGAGKGRPGSSIDQVRVASTSLAYPAVRTTAAPPASSSAIHFGVTTPCSERLTAASRRAAAPAAAGSSYR